MKKLYLTPEDYEIAEKNGISQRLAYCRFYQSGWSKKRAITEKPQARNKYVEDRKEAERNGIKANTFYQRLKMGWSIEDAKTIPTKNKNVSKYEKWLKIARKNGIKDDLFRTRIRQGWTKKEACTIPVGVRRRQSKYGKWPEIAHKNGISQKIFYSRINQGWDIERAATEKVGKVGGDRRSKKVS